MKLEKGNRFGNKNTKSLRISSCEISDLMRESKSWSKSVVEISKVFRAYERAAKPSHEEQEELESNQTVYETAKSRQLAFKEMISETNDIRRNLFTLDNVKSEFLKLSRS